MSILERILSICQINKPVLNSPCGASTCLSFTDSTQSLIKDKTNDLSFMSST